MKLSNMNNNISIGNAGEYYVSAELERRGFSVAVPMSNVPTFDLLAIDRNDYSHQIAVQVKTNGTNKNNEWLLSKKDEQRTEKNFFYILVKFLTDSGSPEYFIVPANVVSKYISETHKAWLATPGKNGKEHKDQNMRKFSDQAAIYKDRWDLLNSNN